MGFSFKHKPAPAWKGYQFALIVCTAATAVGLPFRESLNPENAAMLYLVGIALAAAYCGRASAMLAAIVSAAAYNFFFTRPYYSLWIDSYRDLIATILLLLTSLIIGSLAARLRAQSNFFQHKEQATAALYAMARELASTRGQNNMLSVIRHHVEQMFEGMATLWTIEHDAMRCLTHPELTDDLKEKSASLFAYEHMQPAGLGTPTLAGARGYYIPLRGSVNILGVLGLFPKAGELEPDEKVQLEAIASVVASALERAQTADIAEKSKVEAEGEKMRNALLSSVSHDFRTPLASIKGVISSMMIDEQLPTEERKELLSSAYHETARLERMVGNLLDVTLLESGRLTLKQDYYFIPELVGNAIVRTKEMLGDRSVEYQFKDDLPAVRVDGLLIEQVLVNLLENAGKYTQPASVISIYARKQGDNIHLEVADQGQGIPVGEEQKIFDKFHRGTRSGQGSGLGLAICRGIIQAHGGSIVAYNRDRGGAVFSITLPASAAPSITEEAA
jgi:two-component system sensor histidine kinase KdpD